MAATSAWGQLAWGSANWGGIGVDVTTTVNGNVITILSPKSNGWSIDAWGIDTWGGDVPALNVIAKANVVPTGVTTLVEVGTLTFEGKSFFEVTGSSVAVQDGAPTVIAKSLINASTNLLQLGVQSPNISADGFTEAVTGNNLTATAGDLGFSLDANLDVTGSSVVIGTTQPTVALPTVIPLGAGPSVSTEVGTLGFKLDAIFGVTSPGIRRINLGTPEILSASIVEVTGSTAQVEVGTPSFESRYYVTGSSVQTSTGTLEFSTQQNIQVSANVLTLGSGSLIITNWQQIDTNDNQSWTPIATGDTQTWTPL